MGDFKNKNQDRKKNEADNFTHSSFVLQKRFFFTAFILFFSIIIGFLIWLLSWKNAPDNTTTVLTSVAYLYDNSDINGLIKDLSHQGTEIKKEDKREISFPLSSDTRCIEVDFDSDLFRKSEIVLTAYYVENEMLKTTCSPYYIDRNESFDIKTSNFERISIISNLGEKSFFFDLQDHNYIGFTVSFNGSTLPYEIKISTEHSSSTVQRPAIQYLNLLLSFIFCALGAIGISYLTPYLKSYFYWIRTNFILFVKLVSGLIGTTFLVLLAGWAGCHLLSLSWNAQKFIFFLCVGTAFGLIICSGRYLAYHLTVAYLLFSAIFGLMISGMMRVNLYNCPDDWTHYPNVLAASYGGTAYLTKADESLINLDDKSDYGGTEHNDEYAAKLDKLYRDGAPFTSGYTVSLVNRIGYLPEAFGLMVARALNLSFSWIFRTGKFFGLLFYICVTACAVHILKNGKLLAITVFLLPSIFYQACNYTYDNLVIALVGLGFCAYISSIEDTSAKITIKREIFIFGLIALGAIVKVIYLPLLGIMLYMPKEKFRSRKQRKLYYLLFAVMTVLLAAAVLFFLSRNTQVLTDTRSAGTNGTEQLRYVIGNIGVPFMLFRWMWTNLLSSINIQEILTWVFAFGIGREEQHGLAGEQIWIVLLLFSAIAGDGLFRKTANKNIKVGLSTREEIFSKICISILSLICIYGAVLSMYVAYTPVGAGEVLGCQPRYILPVLLPCLYTFRFVKIKNIYNVVKWRVFHLLMVVIGYGIGFWQIARVFY